MEFEVGKKYRVIKFYTCDPWTVGTIVVLKNINKRTDNAELVFIKHDGDKMYKMYIMDHDAPNYLTPLLG